MTDTNLVDAVVFPQDDGTGVPDGAESYDSAGGFSLLSRYKGDGNYVGEDTNGDATLQFNNVDTGNNEFDVGTGHAYINDSVSIQSGAQTTYDTALPDNVPYVVVLPDEVTNLSLDSGTNDVWLAVDPTANDDVYIRHGSGLSAPSDPSVKLGTVDASSGATTRGQDNADTTFSSVQTPNLQGGYASKLRVTAGGGVIDTIDPANTTTPVQDAVAVAENNRPATVRLPHGVIDDPGPVTVTKGVSVKAPGAETWDQGTPDRAQSTVRITTNGGDGFIVDASSQNAVGIQLLGFCIEGPGAGVTTPSSALKLTDGGGGGFAIANNRFRLSFRNWHGRAIYAPEGKGFQCDFERIVASNIDAGDVDAVIDFRQGVGPGNRFGPVICYPTDTASASDSIVLWAGGGASPLTVESFNIGGTADRVFSGNVGGRLGPVNYEPNALNDTSPNSLMNVSADAAMETSAVVLNGAQGNFTARRVYQLAGTDLGNKEIGMIHTKNGAGYTDGLEVFDDTVGGGIDYSGPTADVVNSTGATLTNPVYCRDGNVK